MENKKDEIKKILVFRFSAMGDVAMICPIIKEFLNQNENTEIIVVSRKNFKAFFENIENLTFEGVDLTKYKGINGLWRLYKELKAKYCVDYVADLHNVLRTRILSYFFSFSVKKSISIKKGRKEKRELTKKNNKNLHKIKSMPQRYADVFRELGFKIILSNKLCCKPFYEKAICMAPFANYKEKTLPIDKSKKICNYFAEKNYIVYLLGGGKKETEILKKWEKINPNIISLAEISLSEQMDFIRKSIIVISMDSSNMHIASIVNTRVLSIWGGTHPFAGFLGYGQRYEDIIQIKDMDCRPCSVFGNKNCFKHTIECLEKLDTNRIINKIENILIEYF